MGQHLVSFGLPVHNGSKYLTRCLESISRQSYEKFEVLICDDCSTVGSFEICESFAKTDSRFVLGRNAHRAGAQDNFIGTLKQAKGEYFVWASQDDWWAPDFLRVLVGRLEGDRQSVVAMSNVECVSVTGATISNLELISTEEKRLPWQHRALARGILLKGRKVRGDTIGNAKANFFIHGVVRREAFLDSVKAYPGRFQQERHLLVQWALSGRFQHVDQTLFFKTVHPDQKRRKGDPNPAGTRKDWHIHYYALKIIISVLRSPLVPIRRKLDVFPVVFEWAGYVKARQ